MSKAALAQYALAALALIGAIVVNLWGKETETLNTIFTAVITGALWGGFQRDAGEAHKR